MAKKPLVALNFIDIVTRADADLIRQALAAREKIDDLLIVREEAYRKIAEVEHSIEELVGEEKVFQFDVPPYSVAGMKGGQPYRPAVKSTLEEKKAVLAESEEQAVEDEDVTLSNPEESSSEILEEASSDLEAVETIVDEDDDSSNLETGETAVDEENDTLNRDSSNLETGEPPVLPGE